MPRQRISKNISYCVYEAYKPARKRTMRLNMDKYPQGHVFWMHKYYLGKDYLYAGNTHSTILYIPICHDSSS